MSKYSRYSLLYLILFLTFGLQAQDAGIDSKFSPDRPGETVGPVKLDKGVLNLELGATFSSYNKDKANINGQSYVGALRYGLLENLEVNMSWGIDRVSGSGFDNISGFGAVETGIKMGIADENGSFPKIEFEGKMALPWFGDEKFRPKDAEPYFKFNFANNFNEQTSINYGVGMFWEGAEEAGLYGFMLIHSFSPKFGGFLEHYGNIRGDINLEPHLGAGIIYMVSDVTQIDLSLDVGRDDGASLFFIDFGVATMLVSGE